MASENGKFLIYPSRFSDERERFNTVGHAVVRIAEKLGADVEVSQRKDVLSTWVFYKNGDKEEIPIYSDWGKRDWRQEDIYHSMRSVIYALSFHPEYRGQQIVRRR